jgi:hypothetical protein
MMKLQERLEQLSPFKDYPESEQEKEDLAETAQAIEKDILELIGWEDNYRLYLVADTKKPIEENQAQAKNILRARNLLRSELRLKLKEYFGEKDE